MLPFSFVVHPRPRMIELTACEPTIYFVVVLSRPAINRVESLAELAFISHRLARRYSLDFFRRWTLL